MATRIENLEEAINKFQDEINCMIDIFSPNIIEEEMISVKEYVEREFKQVAFTLSGHEIREVVGLKLQISDEVEAVIMLFINLTSDGIFNLREVFEYYLALYQIEGYYYRYINEF